MKYTESHEWVTVEDDIVTMGITVHAQEELSDIVYVELPALGDIVTKMDRFMSVESVKAASDIYAPVSGEVVEVNTALEEQPEMVNADAEKEGWFVKIKLTNPSDLDDLMDEDDYQKLLD